MVNATVDNQPVSIVLDGGQSTTVPSNETWRVSIYLGVSERTRMSIDSISEFTGLLSDESSNESLKDVTLTGGQTIAETSSNANSVVFITGFVVNS